MKKTIITTLLATVAMTGWAQTNKYTIHGNFTKVAEAMSKQGLSFDSVTLVNPATIEVVAKQSIQNGMFTIQGTVDKPYYAMLNIGISSEVNGEIKRKNSRMPIIIEPGDIQFDGNNRIPIIQGTPLNDVLSDVTSKRNAPDFIETVKRLFILHKDDAVAIPLLLMLDSSMLEPDTSLLALIGQLSEEAQHHPHVAKVKEKTEMLLTRPKEGDMFKDFAVQYEDKTTRLSDYVGQGKYVLVDFWASWCGPCRAEMPNVVEAYNEYHAKGFEVIGVSFDQKKEAWVNAIGQLKMPWLQISDLGGWNCAAAPVYMINSIPDNILIDPQGKIIDRALRGNALKSRLRKIFGD